MQHFLPTPGCQHILKRVPSLLFNYLKPSKKLALGELSFLYTSQKSRGILKTNGRRCQWQTRWIHRLWRSLWEVWKQTVRAVKPRGPTHNGGVLLLFEEEVWGGNLSERHWQQPATRWWSDAHSGSWAHSPQTAAAAVRGAGRFLLASNSITRLRDVHTESLYGCLLVLVSLEQFPALLEGLAVILAHRTKLYFTVILHNIIQIY